MYPEQGEREGEREREREREEEEGRRKDYWEEQDKAPSISTVNLNPYRSNSVHTLKVHKLPLKHIKVASTYSKSTICQKSKMSLLSQEQHPE